MGLIGALLLAGSIPGLLVPSDPARPLGHVPAGDRTIGLPAHLLDPRTSSGIGRLFVTTTDPAVVPNDGLETNLTAFAPEHFATFTSYQEGVEETIGSYDAVFGIFENYQTPPVPFFSVFSNTTDQTIHLAYWSNTTLFAGTDYAFVLAHASGTSWVLTVNGALFGGNATEATFDFGANASTWAGGLSFSEISLYGNTTTAPTSAPASLVLAVHQSSGWYLPDAGVATFSGPAPWGVEGRLQHPSLAPGAVVSGTGIPAVANGTLLWDSGPVPVSVRLTAPPRAIGLTTQSLSAVVLDASGAGIPGVSVYLADSARGQFTPASSLSNSSGGVFVAWGTPNVTAASVDVLTATVVTFGYRGSASIGVPLTPALHVRIQLSGTATVPPASSVSVAVRTVDDNGTAVGGVFLDFVAVGGTVTPDTAITDSGGMTTVTVATLLAQGVVQLTATVAGAGAWGIGGTQLEVRAPPPPPPYATYALGGLGAAAVVGAAVFLLRRRKRAKPSAEELWGPSLRKPEAPASRTPPGSGAP